MAMALASSGCSVAALGAVVLAVYIATLSPTIAGGDSGELVAEGCILGTAHPPGYPLFTLLGYAISRYTYIKGVWEGSPAGRVNASSALYTAMACACMGFSVQTIAALTHKDPTPLPSSPARAKPTSISGVIFTMLVFAFSPLTWQYAVTAEVFPLNTLFASLLLYLVLEFAATRKKSVVLWGAFISGLALCNQHTIVLFEAPLILWMLFLLRRQIVAKRDVVFALQIGACFLAGLLPYVYLPITGNVNPTLGSWGDLSSLSGFIHHFLRRDYGTFQLFSGNRANKHNEGFTERNSAYATDLALTQGLYVTPYLAAVGAVSALLMLARSDPEVARVPPTDTPHPKTARRKAGKETTAASSAAVVQSAAAAEPCLGECEVADYETRLTPLSLVTTFAFYFLVFHNLSNMPLADRLLFGVHQRFWMQPNTIAFIFSGVGVNVIAGVLSDIVCSTLSAGSLRRREKDCGSGLAGTAVVFACAVLALAAGLIQLTKHYTVSDQSDSYHFHRYARAIIDTLPANSVLVINYDMQWTAIRYLQQCEGYRPDVTAINLSMMTYRWFRHKHALYPTLVFPGSFHASKGSRWIAAEGAFTFKAFVDANIQRHAMFIGGKLSYADPDLEAAYDLVPSGLVRRFTPRGSAPNATVFRQRNAKKWLKVRRALPVLPDLSKYPEETWEWTIGRDFKDALADTAGYYLDLAIQTAANDSLPLVDAVYWLESAIAMEEAAQPDFTKLMYILYKNSGLGHVHLVQNKLLGEQVLPPPAHDHFRTLDTMGWPLAGGSQGNWKKWSTDRFTYTWGRFLEHPHGKQDPQYEVIRGMYVQATDGSRQQQQQQGSSGRKKAKRASMRA